MANEYKLSYTGSQINEKLSEVDNKLSVTAQTLNEVQKAQARANIDAASLADVDGVVYMNSTDNETVNGVVDLQSQIAQLAAEKADVIHNQSASTITEGIFAGQVVASGSAQAPATALLRNSRLVTTDTTPNNNGEICWTYG